MAEHFTTNTTSIIRWCATCGKHTRHEVNCGRLGHCLEHKRPWLTRDQQRRREQQRRRDRQPELFP